MFAANDPHNGGGNHPQDIEICRPVFVGDELVAWVAASAHLIDVGGMTFGSWAPDATECYQEAIRFPPVRLFAGGVEQTDTWALILNNVRLPSLVEMDIRGLVAGCHVSAAKLTSVVESLGVAEFVATADGDVRQLPSASCATASARLADGEYSTDGWVEWGDEQYHLPCRLVVDGDELRFDFTGAPAAGPALHQLEGVPRERARSSPTCAATSPRTCRSPRACTGRSRSCAQPGTIVDSAPPAPIASAHLDVAMNATGLAVQCLQLALGRDARLGLPRLFAGPSGQAALANHSWSYRAADGSIDGWVLSESFQPRLVGRRGPRRQRPVRQPRRHPARRSTSSTSRSLEAWYPMQMLEKRAAPGRARRRPVTAPGPGAACRTGSRATERLTGAMFAMRETLPVSGVAGGAPGAPTEFRIHHADGTHRGARRPRRRRVARTRARCSSSRPVRVAAGATRSTVTRPRCSATSPSTGCRATTRDSVYGVVLTDDGVDEEATVELRHALRQARLASAGPAPISLDETVDLTQLEASGEVRPLCHGIVQVGSRAVSATSGSVLAYAPRHWTDGCPVLEEPRTSPTGTQWVARSYLDPTSGRALHVEAVPSGWPRSFETMPERWLVAAGVDREKAEKRP